MFRNYILIAWRGLLRNKLHSIINVFGLAIGISACLLIVLIVRYETSFDTFQSDGDRIYRVYSQFSGDFSGFNRGVPAAMPSTAKQEVAGIESGAAFHTWTAGVYWLDKKNQRHEFDGQDKIIVAGPDYFELFPEYEWLQGNPVQSLSRPFQVVLTQSKAEKYFGKEELHACVGREIRYRDSLTLTVSGIVKDIPHHTDLDFTDFISLATVPECWLKKNVRLEDWQSTNSSSQFFVRLTRDMPAEKVEIQLDTLVKRHRKNLEPGWEVNYRLEPLREIHFSGEIGIFDNGGDGANKDTLHILILIAVLLLAIAAINFINLETAQALRRAKEVGLRKVMGSTRGKLIMHFLIQSALLTFLAVLMSLPLAEAAILFFDGFIPGGVQISLTDPFTLTFLVVATVGVSFLAGFYPAFSMSSFSPALALKNQVSANSHHTRTGVIRKALIIFQFTFAQALIVATLIVSWQIHFLLTRDLGFSKEAVLYVNAPWYLPQRRIVSLKNELERIPEIEAITLCQDVPASQNYNSSSLKFNTGKEELHHNVYRKFGDTSFLSVFNLHLLAGRNIHRSDSATEYIINETYAKMLGFRHPEEAIDKLLIDDKNRIPIVGVVKDFNFASLREAVEPVVIADEEPGFRTLAFKLRTIPRPGEMETITNKVKAAWKKVYGEEKFECYFLDDMIARFYTTEQRTSKLVTTATVIAVLISCLGLFGLATFTALQRTKEIGIRKVLGATVTNIVTLLSTEFLWLVIIAFVLAAPLSYYMAGQWLSKFAYRIDIGWQVFACTILSSIAIVLISVSYQAGKAALTDPVESLRHE